jgi:hypothetical protein
VKPPRNSAGFCGGGQGLSWNVKPRKEEEEEEEKECFVKPSSCEVPHYAMFSSLPPLPPHYVQICFFVYRCNAQTKEFLYREAFTVRHTKNVSIKFCML